MNNNQNKIIGCLGVPFPADSTLINKSKKELINMLHIAERSIMKLFIKVKTEK